ncbi:MAG TPA: SDR family NAD(P)-dependent oxidoreductase [Thermoanaerobaculia bacterium]|jgi:3-dehydrosphinganine reductase|nr:SDR family NAD(P)-dependent oxidoreductase [Thermoanaerobaculia bacterium]
MIFQDQNVVVTGGSSGIGLATARQLGLQGARLHLLARDAERLEDARRLLCRELGPNSSVSVHAVDVADEPAVSAAIRAIGASGGLAALVCSAGIIRVGRFEEMALADFEAVLATNYLGTLYSIRAAWPYLKAAGQARLGLVSSVAGYTGLYGYAAYAPTKFALAGLAECLRMEGAPYGIRVTVVFPPDTDTPLLEYERAHAPAETRAITAGARQLSAAAVAEKFVAAMTAGKFEVYCNGESRLIRLFKALLPAGYYRVLNRLANKGREDRGSR